MKRFTFLTGLFLAGFATLCIAGIAVKPDVLDKVEAKYGHDARERITDWEKLVNTNRNEHELVKLKLANTFFNNIKYAADEDLWGQRNYWSTPVELLAANGGDCEDYALAKYYTLQAMGVPISKLRLTYVKSLKLNQPHMVLTYYESPEEEPLIMDNLQKLILYATERPDLKPVYSFNGDGLWMTESIVQKESGKKVGDSNKMSLWIDWKNRMAEEGLK
jgi:predicted transglutaminase-like cysteine proteinase